MLRYLVLSDKLGAAFLLKKISPLPHFPTPHTPHPTPPRCRGGRGGHTLHPTPHTP
ncbi:hypothetical protein [Microcystis sp.]|uniref:hypothetical protein n=1 Tax=Microcystis sp. TaxID=1127 RepID=UPI00391D3CFD